MTSPAARPGAGAGSKIPPIQLPPAMASKKESPAAEKKAAPKKKEGGDELKMEHRFLAVVERHPQGVSDDLLSIELPDITLDKRAIIINSLLGKGRLGLFQDGKTIIYKAVDKSDVEKLKGLNTAELMIYQLVEKELNMGIWVRDLRTRSNLSQQQVTKIVKTLMSKKLIKAEKSTAAKNKKVYMLYDLEPAKEVLGLTWNRGGEFDEELLNGLEQACLGCIRSQSRDGGGASPEYITDFIRKQGIFHVPITLDDVSAVCLSLLYDGLIEYHTKSRTTDPLKSALAASFIAPPPSPIVSSVSSPGAGPSSPSLGPAGSRKRKAGELSGPAAKRAKLSKDSGAKPPSGIVYRVVKDAPFSSDFGVIPCSVCPVADKCTEGGVISPESCQYFTAYMEFEGSSVGGAGLGGAGAAGSGSGSGGGTPSTPASPAVRGFGW